jgi:Xaa-Pro aminopeptidase
MVRMAERLTFGTSIADWQERIDVERLRRERADKARQVLRRHSVPALLAARPENTRYLTGLRGPEFQSQLWYVLFFAEHEPVVFHHAGWLHYYPAQVPWIKHWRLARAWLSGGGGCGPEAAAEEAGLFADGIRDELHQRGLAGEPLGVVGFDGLARQSLAARGIEAVDGAPLMLEATKTKTVDEINCLKLAYAAGDAAWNKAWELLRPGTVDLDVSRQCMQAAYTAGADEVPGCNFRSGPTAFDLAHERTGRILSYGDLAHGAFCGIGYLGYKTCYVRTFSVGRPPDQRARDWYKSLVDRLDRVIDAIKPGATTADAAQHFPPVSTWGYQDEAEVLGFEIGHGIGLHPYGYPVVNRQWSLDYPQPFEVGMTLAVEGREGEPGLGGVRLEDGVVVTQNGAELIDHWPREEILTAPWG